MNTFATSYLALSCLFLSCNSKPDPMEHIATLAAALKGAATSDIAITIYTGVGIHTGAYVAKNLLEPILYKFRVASGAESVSELHARASLQKKLNELEEAGFEFEQSKVEALSQQFQEYEKAISEKAEALKKDQNLTAEEKNKKIEALQKRIQQTKEHLNECRMTSYENQIALAAAAKMKRTTA